MITFRTASLPACKLILSLFVCWPVGPIMGGDTAHPSVERPTGLRQPPAGRTVRDKMQLGSPRTRDTELPNAPTRIAIGRRTQGQNVAYATRSRPRRSSFTVIGSLGIVIGLLLLLSVSWRKVNTRASVPADVMEVLGCTNLSGKKRQLMLIRLSNKLLLVNSREGDMQTLAEITDPAEVASIVETCQSSVKGRLTRDLAPRFRFDASNP